MKTLYLLDAYALIYRAYYALIRSPRINSKGQNTSAVYGFVNTLNDVLNTESPILSASPSTPQAAPSATASIQHTRHNVRLRLRTSSGPYPLLKTSSKPTIFPYLKWTTMRPTT